MGNNTGRIFSFITAITISVIVIIGLFQLSNIIYPDIKEPAATYDCDDATLDMYRHFEELGIESVPVVGNLDISGEIYTQSNHVWLLVKYGDTQIAYDWGKPSFDSQHYEGYEISLDYLVYAVQQDEKSPDLLPIADYSKAK